MSARRASSSPGSRARQVKRAPASVWERAAHDSDLTLLLPGRVPMFFRRIPAGSFFMGSRGYEWDEEPRHRVVITRDFHLGTFPVTQEQYHAVARRDAAFRNGAKPSRFKGARRPVEQVSWEDAAAFCAWLGAWKGLPAEIGAVRLPTEAEWEYACRAHTETEYYSGDGESALAEVAWYGDNSNDQTHPVDARAEQHPFGLYGMHGNVWEWCNDWYDKDLYRRRADGVSDPQVSEARDDRDRVLRGGSWYVSAFRCRSAYRFRFGPDVRLDSDGFRVCLVRSPAAGSGAIGERVAEPARGDGAPRDEGAEADRAGGARSPVPSLKRARLPRAPKGTR